MSELENIIALLNDQEMQKRRDCKGFIVKCRISNYTTARGSICSKVEYRPLKKLSCDGSCCENIPSHRCDVDWINDYISEVGISEAAVDMPLAPQDNSIYRLMIITSGRGEDTKQELLFKPYTLDDEEN